MIHCNSVIGFFCAANDFPVQRAWNISANLVPLLTFQSNVYVARNMDWKYFKNCCEEQWICVKKKISEICNYILNLWTISKPILLESLLIWGEQYKVWYRRQASWIDHDIFLHIAYTIYNVAAVWFTWNGSIVGWNITIGYCYWVFITISSGKSTLYYYQQLFSFDELIDIIVTCKIQCWKQVIYFFVSSHDWS